ncbi:MAG: hypothetical protein GY869_26520, partial [Planctomycetes bacterium]|nr:hypothetical protein [Planctomycetota bacterium]
MTNESGPGYTYTYGFDGNGNTIRKSDGLSATDYAFDYENRLIEVQTDASTIVYQYDSDGMRVSSGVDGAATSYLIDKNRPYAQVLEEYENGSLTVSYVYGDDLISQNRGSRSFYQYDGQMSTRQLTDGVGDVTDTYVYDGFG